MDKPVLKIFSYLPNPRVFKAQIAAELCGVSVDVVGAKPAELVDWLWDVEARPLEADDKQALAHFARQGKRGFSQSLYKSDAFLQAHPFGTVPAAFSPSGETGIFESNSILRAVARAGQSNQDLYGVDPYQASRVDSFLDATLTFAREAQVYLLGMDQPTKETHARMQAAYDFYLDGVEAALTGDQYLCGPRLSIADIAFVCDVAQFLREAHYEAQLASAGLRVISTDFANRYPFAHGHLLRLADTPAFASVMGTYLDWYRRARLGAQQ